MQSVGCRTISLATLCVLVGTANAGVIWPNQSDWNAVRYGSGLYYDSSNDVAPSYVDLVGDATKYSAGYWSYQDYGTPSTADDNLFFRMRLDTSPKNCQSVWQVLLDTDTDSHVDWVLQIDMKNDNRVEFVQATKGGDTFAEVALSTTPVWTGLAKLGDTASYANCMDTTGDGSNFNGTPDAFAEMGIPWETFSTSTGLSLTSDFRIALSTSTNHNDIIKDFPVGLSSNGYVSGAWSSPAQAVPEPSSMALLLSAFGAVSIGRYVRRRKNPQDKCATHHFRGGE